MAEHMPESVTVDHDGTTITTNTMSEAALRTEMEAPPTPDPQSPAPEGETAAEQAARARDEKGRFAKQAATEAATPPAEAPAAPEPVPDPDQPSRGRRRDDSLPRHSPITRINQAMAAKMEAERRAAALEAELLRITQQAQLPTERPTTPQGNGPGEPLFEQFADQADPYTAYLQAWTRWDRAQGLAQARAEWEAAESLKHKAQTFQSRVTEGKVHYPDFDNVLQNADTLGLQVSAVMQEAIAASPKAADLVYYLATHPEECTQLAEESSQTPVAAATVMQRLLESHLAPRAVPPNGGSGAAARAPVSTAKPPVSPVGSSPVVSDDPPGEAASAAEHARYWNRRLKVPGT